jgi:NAD-dependent SIR2 family protein deacetylase
LRCKREECNGPIKPNITFFGEPLPQTFFEAWDKISNAPKNDQRIFPEKNPEPKYPDGGCDLMIIIGTALAVKPFANTIHKVKKSCPQVLINLENTARSKIDFHDLEN